MLKKNASKKLKDKDFTALDAAVSELSKQTEALLGSATTNKADKPTLPKKKAAPTVRGKSFDIIHNPHQKSSKRATLKTAHVTRHKVAPALKPLELLPDHAGKSFNELEPETQETVDDAKSTSSTPLVKHHVNSLVFTSDETTEPDNQDTPKEQSEKSVAQPKADEAPEPPVEAESTKEKPVDSKDENTEEPLAKFEPSSSQDSSEDTTEEATVEPPAYNSGELFANNLVKEVKKKSYKPDENQQKPTVFDTNEYHAELHDWSRLEHKSGLSWLILLALVIIAAVIAYFILSGQTIPSLG